MRSQPGWVNFGMERTYHFLLGLKFLIEANGHIEDNDGRDDATFDVVCHPVRQCHGKHENLREAVSEFVSKPCLHHHKYSQCLQGR